MGGCSALCPCTFVVLVRHSPPMDHETTGTQAQSFSLLTTSVHCSWPICAPIWQVKLGWQDQTILLKVLLQYNYEANRKAQVDIDYENLLSK